MESRSKCRRLLNIPLRRPRVICFLFSRYPVTMENEKRPATIFHAAQFDSCPSFSFFTLARDIARFSFCERCNSITVRSFYFSTTRERTIYNLVKISPLSSFWSMLQESRFGWGGGKKKRYFEIFGSKYVRYISRLIYYFSFRYINPYDMKYILWK